MRKVTLFLLVIGYAVSIGCALKERTIQPLPKTFLEDIDLSKKRENLPFDHAWIKPGKNKSAFQSVYFKPVRTDLLPDEQWERSASVSLTSKSDYMGKAEEIARYFREQLVEQTRKHGGNEPRFQVLDQPRPSQSNTDTLVIEVAFTELELAHPVARAGSLVAPIPGTGPAIAAVSDPHVAFAARITNARTGELVATAADRKFAPTRVLDVNKLTVSSSAREIVALWADSIGQALQSDGFAPVKEKRFEILPW